MQRYNRTIEELKRASIFLYGDHGRVIIAP